MMKNQIANCEYFAGGDEQIRQHPRVRKGRKSICNVREGGFWRLTYKDAIFYSILVNNCGSWGLIRVFDGKKRLIWEQRSAFTGSFVMEGGCDDGIIVQNGYVGQPLATDLVLTWKE